jgi:hypothetical protein
LADTLKSKNTLPFTMVYNVIIKDDTYLTIYEKFALITLLYHANNGTAWPSYSSMSKNMRCSVRTAFTAIDGLIDKKFLTKTARINPDTKGRLSNLYTIEDITVAYGLLNKKANKSEKINEAVTPEDTEKYRKVYHIRKKQKENPPQFAQTEADTYVGDTSRNYYDIVAQNIDLENLKISNIRDSDRIDELYELIVDTLKSNAKTFHISKENKPANDVKAIFLRLRSEHIEYVITSLDDNTTDVRNHKNYYLTTLYNSIMTKANYYHTRVNHDLYGS